MDIIFLFFEYIANIIYIFEYIEYICYIFSISFVKKRVVIKMKKDKESKRDKFVRLAEARTNKIIDMLQLLGNCSNTSTYSYTQSDVDKIFSTIESEVREVKKKFNKTESKKGARFSLD